MEQQNPTGSDAGASTPDPLDRIQAFLDAQEGGESNEAEGNPQSPESATKTPDKPSGDEPGKDSEPQFTTAHLAQYLGIPEDMIDVDEDGQPVFKTKIDGKEQPAKFQDFLKDYQLKGHAENRAREAAAKEQAAERKMQEAEQAIQARQQHIEQQLQHAGELAVIAQQELAHDYNQINWSQLWQEDPGRAGILKEQFQQRANRVGQMLQNIQGRRAQAAQHAEQQRQASEVKNRERQISRLLELIPDWKDQAVAEKERTELLNWIARSGYDPADLDLNKASQVHLLRTAWQHATLQQSKPAIEQKLRSAPKLVKPGQPADKAENATAQLRSLKQQMRQTGRTSNRAIEEYLMATGKA